ncbi:beta-ketoacyl-[acyl-carrier-protein] synthase family protein [Kitasatospora sp. NPDC096077]|uniref:beta-ketoacyl-[acyl-carrier-protein] synthase family protein n=1 Tax=Kitasatospora sp. NPDC096077 TaxID=3155544 RepID=UPI00332BB7B5
MGRARVRRTGAAVTGVGLLTPAGPTRESTWERVCVGKPTSVLARQDGLTFLACRAPADHGGALHAGLGRAAARRPDRSSVFALHAAREAILDSGLDPAHWDGARVGVVAGIGGGACLTYDRELAALQSGGPDDMSPFAVPSALPNSIAGQLAIEFNIRNTAMAVATACASGTTAIGIALDLLTLDRCDVVLVGGAEACLNPFYIAGFDRLNALSHRFHDPSGAPRPFDSLRDGFVMAEGAGFLVLERPQDARARQAHVRGVIAGYGAVSDAHHVVAPRPDGSSMTAAIRAALADAGAAPCDVDLVNAHATGTPLGDTVEASAIAATLPHLPPVTANKGVLGHMMAAAGAVEAALTVLSLEYGTIPPTANLAEPGPEVAINLRTTGSDARMRLALSTSAGFGGHNGALAITTA